MIELTSGPRTRSQQQATTHEGAPKPNSPKAIPAVKNKRFDGVHIPIDRNNPSKNKTSEKPKSNTDNSTPNHDRSAGSDPDSSQSLREAALERIQSVTIDDLMDESALGSEREPDQTDQRKSKQVRFRDPSPPRTENPRRPFDDVQPREVTPHPRNQPKPEKIPESKGSSKAPKYRLQNELFTPGLEEELADRIVRKTIELTSSEALQLSGKIRQIVARKIRNKRVLPQDRKKMLLNLADQQDLATETLSNDDSEDEQVISVDDLALPEAWAFERLSEDRDGMKAGAFVQVDPVESFLSDVDENDERRDMTIVATIGNGLRAVWPVVNDREDLEVENLLDSGSQIVAIDMSVALGLGLGWDPGITIQMQNVHGGIARTKGLARNVPFRFGPVTVYLQLHVQEKAPFEILLGRPFDVLTESVIQTFGSGDQELTITDPNTGKRYTMGTYPKGHGPRAPRKVVERKVSQPTQQLQPESRREDTHEEAEKVPQPNF